MTEINRRWIPTDFLAEMLRNPLDPGYAEAARRRALQGPPSSARRTAGWVARGVVLALTGFLLTVAYHQTASAQPESSRARAGLVADVRSLQQETDQLQQQAAQLRDAVARQRDAALAAAGTDADQLRRLELATGTSKVSGAGAVIRLADAPAQVDPVTGKPHIKQGGTVYDQDLQYVANELWRDGAEAIAINGERLTATSTIRRAGDTILVDYRPISSPYLVSAIGPGDLDRRFSTSTTGQRFAGYVSAYGIQVSASAKDNLTLPAASDPQLHYAEQIPSPSPSAGHPSSSGGR